MNQLAREIITEILTSEQAWDKKTRQLKYKWVIDTYIGERAYRFDNEFMIPRLLRAHRMLSVWYSISLDESGWLDDGEVSDAISEQLCGDSFYNVLGYPIVPGLRERQYWRDSYFSKVWESEEWACEDISEGDILALNIHPTLVPAKTDQPALF